jgi:antitoxin component YwqK of YwqJK toxin-antitoxin module
MKYFLFIGFLTLYLSVKAQETRLFFNEKHHLITDSTKARYFKIVRKLNDSAWYVKEYDSNKILTRSGVYRDQQLKILNGVFTDYGIAWVNHHDVRFIETMGSYQMGKLAGEWLYYGSSGFKYKRETYLNGKLEGLYQTFADSNKVVVEGCFHNDKREGDWYVLKSDGHIQQIDTYEAGQVVSTTFSGPDAIPNIDSLVAVEKMKANDPGASITTKHGATLIGDTGSEKAQFSNAYPDFDFVDYVNKQLSANINQDVSGWLMLQFIVDSSGKISNIEVMRALDKRIDAEVINAISGMQEWHPAHKGNDSVSQLMYCVVKIRNSSLIINYATSPGQLIGAEDFR